jgi:biopolymer transport protein ExbD
MYRVPSRRSKRHGVSKPNLIPILDAVFIFIFFLLMSANFVKIFEIGSDVPMVSDAEPPKNDKPLALTLQISRDTINVMTGIPSSTIKKIGKGADGFYDLNELHDYLIGIKQKNQKEKTVIFEPTTNLSYADIVKIMDAARMLKHTDPAIYVQSKDGIDEKIKELFSNIIFGNIQS